MLMCKVVSILCLFGISNAEYSKINYSIPRPEIQAFSPRGFRISIEDSRGISRVEFHLNINKINTHAKPKKFFKDVQRKRDGKWMFMRPKFRLQIGDTINYSLLVVKDRLGYRLDGGPFVVQELVSYPPKPNQHEPPKDDQPPKVCRPEEPPVVPSTPTPPSPQNERDSSLLLQCQQVMLNTTYAMMSLQNEIEKLKTLNEQLESFVENYPGIRKLTLSGRIPPDDEPSVIVRFILKEKLDLEPKINWAKRHGPNNITFEVSNVSEKMEILNVAKYNLMHSKIIIT